MDFLNIHKQADVKDLKAGQLLIAEPFLGDPNFSRVVIFLCEHSDEGSVGFILNKPTDLALGDLVPEIYAPSLMVSQGGPVQLDTLHMLHRIPARLGGNEIIDGIYWGGSYEAMQDMIRDNNYDPNDLKLFLGYTGWSPGQLEKEVKEGSWLISGMSPKLIFETQAKQAWKDAVKSLGKEYQILANMPLNPQLN